MATGHRPDLEALEAIYRLSDDSKWDKTKHRDPFVWPSINQEDLCKPKTLLILLNARGRHCPSDFAGRDCETLNLGKATNAIIPIVVSQSTMILNGAKGPNEYGRILAWEEHPYAYHLKSTKKQFLPEEGFIILEAQERLLSFLVNCCHQILHDIPKETMTSDTYPIKPQPQLPTEADSTGFDSLAVVMAETPYRAPAQLDLERIEALLCARRSAAEDHLWSLREDPGYFSDTFQELAEHRKEMIKYSSGEAHPMLDKTRKHIFWARVSGNVLFDAYCEFEIFADLEKQARDLRALQVKHAAAISPSEDLPEEYLRAILKFRYYLYSSTKPSFAQLHQHVAASPSFRRFFYREKLESKWAVKDQDVKRMGKVQFKLFELLKYLWEGGMELYAQASDMLDELDRLLSSDPSAKELISPYIANIIGDVSIISQCQMQLDTYDPWARGFAKAMERYNDDITKECQSEAAARFTKLLTLTDEDKMIKAVEIGDISGGRLAYPIDKRRTKANVEILRRSEASLDAFWVHVDQTIQSAVGPLDESAFWPLLAQSRVIQRTPEWVEPSKQPKSEAIVPTTDRNSEAIYKSMSALHISSPPSKTKDVKNEPPKVKTKTRGKADASSSSPSEETSEDPVPSDPQPIFQVDARTLKVIRTIFHDPSAAAPQGEVPWQDFLRTLTSVGFAAEKLYGSVWQFRPVSLDVDRSIQFHEPHPRGKVPFRVARRHGRRLNRAYGWNAGMFELKEK